VRDGGDDVGVRDATLASRIIDSLAGRHQTIAVAESLTGGLLVAALVSVPGASAVVNGGIVAYNTELKHTLLGVDASLLAAHGPVHPDVAREMAIGVRDRLAVRGEPASIGIATTGVAGPTSQGGHEPGLAYIGIAMSGDVRSLEVHFEGTREDIRNAVVNESLVQLARMLGLG
jgi:nicotinamide-nucleotide amidase